MQLKLSNSKLQLWNDSWVNLVNYLKMKSWEISRTSKMMPWRSEMTKLINLQVFSIKTKNLMIKRSRKMMKSKRCIKRKKIWLTTSNFLKREWLRWILSKSRLIKKSYNLKKKKWKMMNRWVYWNSKKNHWRKKSRSLKIRLSRLKMTKKKISKN